MNLRKIKDYAKDHKYTIVAAIPALLLDADAAAMLYNYSATGDPRALAAGAIEGITGLWLSWTACQSYFWDEDSIAMRKDRERSAKIMKELGL